ncbi:hypothetical protein [Prochlorococcus marinus]|uniref:Uncharacterized protein n=1 Tax=Prochlorococcus marinus (strain AS9601) TaxID=146891 RepID=A2BQU9_PROMS|nr:hypothetical protein [Prochlorococcus marinus]ABM70160.1 Conserved hypothetical protein [Prochlorococcus marinus str. AS9601]
MDTNFFINYEEINFNSINIMINYFALTVTEMGIGKIELAVIGSVILIFPILFVYASKNLDAKEVFEWMMEKPNDWIGKK